MRDAQSLLDQITAGAEGEVSDEEALAALGIADRSVVYAIAGAVIERNACGVLEALEGAHRLGCDLRRLTRDLLEHFRNLTVMHVSEGKLLPELPSEELDSLRRQAGAIAPRDADRCFRLLLQTDDEVSRSPYPKLVLEMALLRLVTMEPLVPVDDLLRRIESLNGGTASAGGHAAPRPTVAVRSGNEATRSPRGGAPEASEAVASAPGPTRLRSAVQVQGDGAAAIAPVGEEAWHGLRQFACERAPALAAHLGTCTGTMLSSGVLEIEAPAGFRANYLRDVANASAVEALATEFFGRSISLRVTTVGREPGPKDAPAEQTQADRAGAAMRHPAVQAALEILDGELAEVRQRRPRDGGGA